MTLQPGARLGPYEITGAIGAGGMGEVFRARDTKLNRDVAIKVLPAAFADDPERLARFTREAQTLASLNHPNIATIHGIEEVPAVSGSTGPGSRALVMELVEGEDLSAHIARGPIPMAEALPIARQIAEALEAAHEQGIIHRDLKPANIKVRTDGTVKVLDFGLAKAMDPAGASSTNPNVSHSPTLTHQGTQAGMIIGTAAYMSPEQAKGKTVDRRTDIWAFGVVLYEMISGRRAFKGDDVSETLASVLKDKLSMDDLPADTPARLKRLIERCLDRDLKTRLRDIGEARVKIARIEAGGPDAAASVPGAAAVAIVPVWRRALPWAAAVVFGAALATIPLLWTRSRAKPADNQQIRFSIPTPDTLGDLPAISAAPVISPDGRFVVFPSPPALGKPPVLWLRPMEALEAQPLPGTEEAEQPFWSPDSRHVGFAASGKLKKIDISGGPPQNLCDVVGTFVGGTWNREGVLVFSEGGKLVRVSNAGGPRSDLGSSEQTGSAYLPVFLPDGRHFIYSTLAQGLHVASLDGGPPVQVLDVRSMAAYASPGFLLYHREGVLFAHAFDAKHFQLAGEPVRVADGVALTATGVRAAFSVSDTGVLVFRTGRAADSGVELAWMSRAGKAMGTVGEPGKYNQIRLSPDEKRVAMQGATSGLFTLDLGSRITSGLTFNDDGLSSLADPLWRPDGRALAFYARVNGKHAFYQQILGTRDATVVFEFPDVRRALSDWSPDGRFLLFQTLTPSELYAAPLSGDPKPVLLAKSQKTIDSPHFSPDGKWVSYNTNESGTPETWVASFPAADHRQQVSSHGGGQARWRADGKELFYLAPDGQVMSVAIESDPKTGALEFKAPTVLFQSPIARPNMNLDQYDVTRDGQRFIFLKPRIDPNTAAEPLAPITVVLNWQAGLTK